MLDEQPRRHVMRWWHGVATAALFATGCQYIAGTEDLIATSELVDGSAGQAGNTNDASVDQGTGGTVDAGSSVDTGGSADTGGAIEGGAGDATPDVADADAAPQADAPSDAPVDAVDACTPNACGGCGTLTAQPGTACGKCGSYQCVDSNTVACSDGVRSIVAGSTSTCALTWAGGVRCWGDNSSGQLGDGTGAERLTPPPNDVLTGVDQIAMNARGSFVCALKAGRVRCWGGNGSGQQGNGWAGASVPTVPIYDILANVRAIAVAVASSCALMNTGTVRCWGAQVAADGGWPIVTRPPATDFLSDAQALAAGGGHDCIVTTSGGVRCWGVGTYGQLGDGLATDSPTPTGVVLTGVNALSLGGNFSCALMAATGGVRCWGYGERGQLGVGPTGLTGSTLPPDSDVLAGAKAISAGGTHTCALMNTGGLRCWGDNLSGKLGYADASGGLDAPRSDDVLTGVRAVSAGDSHTCAVMASGGVRCWGDNSTGQLGTGNKDTKVTPGSTDINVCP